MATLIFSTQPELSSWNRSYDELLGWMAERDGCPPLNRADRDAQERALGVWLTKQALAARNGTLSAGAVQRLEGLESWDELLLTGKARLLYRAERCLIWMQENNFVEPDPNAAGWREREYASALAAARKESRTERS